MTSQFIDIQWGPRRISIEHRWLAGPPAAPLMVFLHEGLGSVSMWREFPAHLCGALGWRGLVYSRPGYGQSTARVAAERWAPDFMHRQACEVLPALLNALGVDTAAHPPWLFGHSDGGSIALLHCAARSARNTEMPARVAGAIVLAPHIMVEDISIASIAAARTAYTQGTLKARLAKHHADADSAFWGWNDIWLDPAFRSWSIEARIASIQCPLLAVQGLDDEYGSLAQIRGIAARAPQTQLLELARCGHSPHRDQSATLIAAVAAFAQRLAA